MSDSFLMRRGGDCSILVVAGGGFGSVASDIAVVVVVIVVVLSVSWPAPVSVVVMVGLEVVGLRRFGSGEEGTEGGLCVADWAVVWGLTFWVGGVGFVPGVGRRGAVGLQGLGWGNTLRGK